MNRQQKRASARSASKRDTAEGMAAVAMAARVAALSPESRADLAPATPLELSQQQLEVEEDPKLPKKP